ncbi:hypothetical protein L21SP2_0714 [Salinispira pacifica]|uniref:YihY/virulence factor BrkB family protein n=2 Tax=Salinispira pacifica TaxID=1307761 RepID=V5WF22_9SPIO|nr:hypothetical protein L21SP2_0714 [Salinispira pacifica]
MVMFRDILRHVMKRYDRINGPLLAKGLGFSLILGILPLLFIALSAGAYLLNLTPELQDMIIGGLGDFIPVEILQNYLSKLFEYSQNWQSLSIITIVFFLIFSLNLFNALGRVLRTILSRKRSTVTRHNLISLILLTGSLLLFYLSIIIGSRMDLLAGIIPLTGSIAQWARTLFDVLSITIVLTVLYYIYSNRSVDFLPTAGVALLSAVIWEGVSTLGVVIIRSMTNRFLIFGAMATPIILLVYLRIFAEIIIFSSLVVDYFSSRLYSGYEPLAKQFIHEHIQHEHKS